MPRLLLLLTLTLLAALSTACGVPGATPTPDAIVPLTVVRKTPVPMMTPSVQNTSSITSTQTGGFTQTPLAANATPAPVITLPIPQTYSAKAATQTHAWVQMTLSPFEPAPVDAALEASMRYLVLRVTFKNVSSAAHDAVGLPFSLGLGTYVSQPDLIYYSQPYAPGNANLWTLVDKLSSTASKPLGSAQTLSGVLYFQIPEGAVSAYVVWKPVVQAQYVWPSQTLPPLQVMSK